MPNDEYKKNSLKLPFSSCFLLLIKSKPITAKKQMSAGIVIASIQPPWPSVNQGQKYSIVTIAKLFKKWARIVGTVDPLFMAIKENTKPTANWYNVCIGDMW